MCKNFFQSLFGAGGGAFDAARAEQERARQAATTAAEEARKAQAVAAAALADGLDSEGARRQAEGRQRRLLGQRRSRIDDLGDAPVALKSLFGV